MKMINKQNRTTLRGIQQLFFRSQLILIVTLAVFLGVAGTLVNLQFENQKRDQNLQNVAEVIARSPLLAERTEKSALVFEYLDSLKETLDNIDVISVVGNDCVRIYHSNHDLIGTVYDGNLPEFEKHSTGYYTADETGPSGRQRRAYAAVYDLDGNYTGFVMAITLMENIRQETMQMFFVFLLITVIAVLIELIISGELSGKIKRSLMGYEPDVFTSMYRMREGILGALDEGILAVDTSGKIQFANDAAIRMLGGDNGIVGKSIDAIGDPILANAMKNGDREFNVNLANADILLDRVPIREDAQAVGAIAVLHNRAEYTKLMEDLSGTRYLVDSMRANNHDFTNKLHVILGLIQMEMYDDATSYIQNITMVQRENISRVMNAVSEPAVAALLIGKIARASELNVEFVLREGCCYSAADMNLPSEMLITVIGNLLDNAFEAMNGEGNFHDQKELMFGIYSRPGAVLITVDDTGSGIGSENLKRIFENGYSTKGEGRGTGLYQVKAMVENYGGRIAVESQEGAGTSFTVSFARENSAEK